MAGVLHVVGGNDRGNKYDLQSPETRIGRGADQDVVLTDIAVSRRHVTIAQEGAVYRLRDLGSGNGTSVNGQRVDQWVLTSGDQIEIGNTVLRFESVAAPAAAGYGAPPRGTAYGVPGNAPTPAPVAPTPAPVAPAPAPAPVAPAPVAPAPAPMPVAQPAWAAEPAAHSGGTVMPMHPGRRPAGRGPLETTGMKVLVFGSMLLLCVGGAAVILSRTVFAKPVVVASEAEDLYRQGVRLFAAGDFEGAKVNFAEAARQVPDSPEPKRYADQCDVEIRVKGALKVAERSLAGKHYATALAALDNLPEDTVASDQIEKMRRDNGARAAAELVAEARATSDAAAASAKIARALALDPNNPDARALAAQAGAAPAPVAPAPAPAAQKSAHATAPPPAPSHGPVALESSSRHHGKDLSIPLMKERHVDDTTAPAMVTEVKTATAAYKSKDFAGAEKACRLESLTQSSKQADKDLALANQIRQLKTAHDRAGIEETSNPEAATKDYTEAMSIDGRIAHGMHAAYFKQKIAKAGLASAQAAFGQGRFDVAFQLATAAHKNGAGDGGLFQKLESKAGEMTAKGESLKKSNPNQAKTLWRMVIKMVPVGSPAYAKAYALLNSASAPHRDEDEN
jgi:tetratricopeptide (TPR) repeat protein